VVSEPTLSEFEQLSRDYRAMAGPLEFLVDRVQEGIELEHFRDTKAGKILIGRALHAAGAALELILDPISKDDELRLAIAELRVQHRVLDAFAAVISAGNQAGQTIEEQSPEEE
jgi:hypothetical protein